MSFKSFQNFDDQEQDDLVKVESFEEPDHLGVGVNKTLFIVLTVGQNKLWFATWLLF
jgi:hypothetical protein